MGVWEEEHDKWEARKATAQVHDVLAEKNSKSAWSCGCDPGCVVMGQRHLCEYYPHCTFGKSQLRDSITTPDELIEEHVFTRPMRGIGGAPTRNTSLPT